ncbi:MAG: M23 family metallopeptidase [Agathobacter sp.]|nr:M23 family metallopeptidase [Agathobacter sp.]
MKRYKYVVAITCFMLSAIGFVGLYMTSQTQEEAKNKNIVEESEEIILGSNLSESEDENIDTENQIAGIDEDVNIEDEQNVASDKDEVSIDENQELAQQEQKDDETQVGNIKPETLHFNPKNGVVWPIEGNVLIDYSMDATIFFPTLQQYQYSPAMVIAGRVNDRVYFVAKGKITNIETNEETGCTVTQDIGDGYTAIYGQLKELNFEVGDMVESGQVVGYVSEPTKYYSVEGSNVYFQLLKDGVPVDPEEILP